MKRCCLTCGRYIAEEKACYEGGFSEIGDPERELTEEDCNAYQVRLEELEKQITVEVKMAGKIRCPDCKRELDKVVIERFESKVFTIDYEYQALAPQPDSIWEFNDWTAHCPYCDSLNVDVLVKNLEFDVKDDALM